MIDYANIFSINSKEGIVLPFLFLFFLLLCCVSSNTFIVVADYYILCCCLYDDVAILRSEECLIKTVSSSVHI